MSDHSQAKFCSDACRREGARKNWRDYGDRNREDRRAYYRKHYEENKESVSERIKKYQASPAGKAASRKTYQHQKEKAPHKIAARQAVLVAVRDGRLVKQPCARCGARRVHGHHTDYSKPLEVVWLCGPCHREEHKRLKEIQS